MNNKDFILRPKTICLVLSKLYEELGKKHFYGEEELEKELEFFHKELQLAKEEFYSSIE